MISQECKLVDETVFPPKANHDAFTKGAPSLLPKCILRPGDDYDCDAFGEKEDSDDQGQSNSAPVPDQPEPPDPASDAELVSMGSRKRSMTRKMMAPMLPA